jgi:hypothetical protein
MLMWLARDRTPHADWSLHYDEPTMDRNGVFVSDDGEGLSVPEIDGCGIVQGFGECKRVRVTLEEV